MHPADPQVRAFIARSMIARVAVLSPKGIPFMTPLWFVYHRGTIHMPTGSHSLVARYLSANPSVILLFDAERGASGNHVLRLRGKASVRHGVAWPVILRTVGKYLLSSLSRGLVPYVRKFALIRQYYAQNPGGAVTIEVVPEETEFLARPAAWRTG